MGPLHVCAQLIFLVCTPILQFLIGVGSEECVTTTSVGMAGLEDRSTRRTFVGALFTSL